MFFHTPNVRLKGKSKSICFEHNYLSIYWFGCCPFPLLMNLTFTIYTCSHFANENISSSRLEQRWKYITYKVKLLNTFANNCREYSILRLQDTNSHLSTLFSLNLALVFFSLCPCSVFSFFFVQISYILGIFFYIFFYVHLFIVFFLCVCLFFIFCIFSLHHFLHVKILNIFSVKLIILIQQKTVENCFFFIQFIQFKTNNFRVIRN